MIESTGHSLHFAHPYWLLWIVPIVGLFFSLLWFRRMSRNKALSHFSVGAQKVVFPDLGLARYSEVSLVLRALASVSACVALARPQWPIGVADIKVRGLEIVVAVDLSASMLAEDLKPSRLDFAKSELGRFFDSISGDRVGLVGFAGSALLISPLTSDASSLKMFLDSMTPRSVQSQGTDIAKALREAADAFRRGGVEDDDQSRSTRVIVLLSDGEDHEKEAIQEARKLVEEAGVRIYTVAFGTERGGPIPIRDERGFLRGYKQDSSGREIVSQVKGEFLADLAREGKGSFRFATFGESPMMALKSEVDLLAKSEIESKMAASHEELFQIALWFTLLFCLCDWLGLRIVQIRRNKGKGQKSAYSLAGLFIIASLNQMGCTRQSDSENMSVSSYWNLLSGIYSLKQDRFDQSLDRFGEATVDSPSSPLTHFHLGSAHFFLKREESALTALEQARLTTNQSDLLFQIHFNRGFVFSSMKGKRDEALREYQMALSFKPNSIETKTNIELLIQQSQQGGQGDSDEQENQSDETDSGDQDSKEPNQNKQPESAKQKSKPKPFESKDLTEHDVARILEELKRQEDSIREKMQREGGKETAKEKDW